MQQGFEIEWNWLSALIAINAVLFLIPIGLDTLLGGGFSQFLIIFGALETSSVFQSGEVWRMVTSNFLHVDLLHLGFNMLALWNLGTVVHQYYGGKLLLGFYMITGLAGSLLSALFLGPALTVGASGAVFGLIGVLVGNSLKNNPNSMDLPFRVWDILPIAGYSLLFGFIPGTNINNIAHFAGLGMGVLLGYIIDHKITYGVGKKQQYLADGIYWVSIVMLVVSYLMMVLNLLRIFKVLS